MKTKVECPQCDAVFTITGPHEPNYCSFCAEPIKLYEEDPLKEELEETEQFDEDDDIFDEDLDEENDEDE